MLPPEIAYFRTIFRGEMIAALSRFRDWLIFDGEQVATTPPAYRAYALRLMLHGREDRIVAALRLEDLGSNQCVWAERYTVTLDGLAALHRTALRQMAVALNVQLSAPRLLTARDAASPAGRRYELWMQALALASDWRAESDARAEQILRDLIATHPDFAPAMVALAQLINTRPIVYPGKTLRRARLEESLALSARAVALDPLDSRTHLCRSWSHAMAGAYSAALSHLDLALDLNENDPWTLISAGLGFAFCGEADRALDYVAQARAFGMRHSRAATGYMVTASYLIGDYEAAIRDAEVAGDAIINLPAWAAASHIRLGQPEAAAAAIDAFLRLTRAGWAGAGEPTERSAIDWFMGCFPIRSDRVRSELAGELAAALEARKKRRP
jgi:tetratricopeptide (TPR) repeat protein